MPDVCFNLTLPNGRSKLGGGIPGVQPILLGGGGGAHGGSGMVGGQERAIARERNRQTMNTKCFLQKILGNDVTMPRTTPFRTAMNAGDMLGTFDSGPLAQLGHTNQLYGVSGHMQHFRRDGIHKGSAGFTGNQKFVYDSSDYIRFKSQSAKLKTYNDLSFGGAGAGKGGVGRMAVTVARSLGKCCAGRRNHPSFKIEPKTNAEAPQEAPRYLQYTHGDKVVHVTLTWKNDENKWHGGTRPSSYTLAYEGKSAGDEVWTLNYYLNGTQFDDHRSFSTPVADPMNWPDSTYHPDYTNISTSTKPPQLEATPGTCSPGAGCPDPNDPDTPASGPGSVEAACPGCAGCQKNETRQPWDDWGFCVGEVS